MLDNLGQVLIGEAKYAEADAVYNQTAALQDTLIGRADTLLVKTALIAGADQFYTHHFSLIAEHFRDPDRGYEVVEQGRGRAIVDLLLSGSYTSPKAIDTERRIARLRLSMNSIRSPDEFREQRELILLTEQARAVNPSLTILATKHFKPISIHAVQSSLSESEMVLEYVIAEPSSYCLVLTKTKVQVVRLPTKQHIDQLVASYLKAIQANVIGKDEAHQLYDALLRPIPLIETKSRYVVIPDGALNLLPFDALIDSNDRYVVQSKVVTYAPSSTTLYLLRSTKFVGKESRAVLAVGGVPYSASGLKQIALDRGHSLTGDFGDLPNSGLEAEAALAALPDSASKILIDKNATETNLKKELTRQFGYIHLAVHAFSSNNPDRSSLVVLSDPGNGEDGFVQASEIVQMRIPAKLVVLSACDTDVGPIEGEEGLSSLSNAFLLAGARTVISTLWAIEDEPSLFLMKQFYEHLRKGESPAISMTEAKRTMLSTFGANSPIRSWAGFVVEGSEPRSSTLANTPFN